MTRFHTVPYCSWLEYQASAPTTYDDSDNPFGWEGFLDALQAGTPRRGHGQQGPYSVLRDSPLRLTICPYCSAALESRNLYHRRTIQWARTDVVSCAECGWWIYCFSKNKDYPSYDEIRNELFEGIIYHLPGDPGGPPIAHLRHKIVARKIDLRSISPTQLEVLVGSVFRDHLGVFLRHVGGPGDNGIDLLVSPDEPRVAIQVKRRASPDSTEAVGIVRDFLGSILLAGVPRGIVVSTAASFSPAAHHAANSPVLDRYGISLELYNYDQLRDLLAIHPELGHPWMKVPRISQLHELWHKLDGAPLDP